MKINTLEILYEKFINGNMTVEELQSRIETMLLPDGLWNLEKLIRITANELEEIIYCYPLLQQKPQAIIVLDNLRNNIASMDEL